MKSRTITTGLPKTHQLMTRLCKARKLIKPYTFPETVIGGFMKTFLAHQLQARP